MNKLFKYYIIIIFFYSETSHCTNIYINSIPKCGTFLLAKCITLLTSKQSVKFFTESATDGLDIPKITNKKFLLGHSPYSKNLETKLAKENYKVFLIYRDPRDQVISHAKWILENSEHYAMCDHQKKCPLPLDAIIDILIEKDLKNRFNLYLEWFKSPIVCPIKFENLVGPQGGGNLSLQKNEIKKICNHIKIDCKKNIDSCIKQLFGNTLTFRGGQIGKWKKILTQQQKDNIKKYAGELIINLGYEKDNNW